MPSFLKLHMYQIVLYLSVRLFLLLNVSFDGLYAWITHQLVQGDHIYKSYETSLLLANYHQFIRNYSRLLTCIQLHFYSVDNTCLWVWDKEIGAMSDKLIVAPVSHKWQKKSWVCHQREEEKLFLFVDGIWRKWVAVYLCTEAFLGNEGM